MQFFNAAVILLGMLFLSRSILVTRRILSENSKRKSTKVYKFMSAMLGLFLIGYAASAFLVVSDNTDILNHLLSWIFLFGGLFTTFSMLSAKKLLDELRSHNENLEQLVEERSQELVREKSRSMEEARYTSIGRMAGGVAHEINNPLTVIQGMAQILERNSDSPPNEQKLNKKPVKSILNASDRIAIIVEKMRTLAANPDTIPIESTNLRKFVEQTLAANSLLTEKKCQFAIHIDEQIYVKIRKTHFSQALDFIFDNAAYYFDGQLMQQPTISAELSPDQQVTLSIKDYGPGIDPKVAGKIFDPFFTTKPIGGGAGLGLSVAKINLMEMKAELKLTNNANPTEFQITVGGLLVEQKDREKVSA